MRVIMNALRAARMLVVDPPAILAPVRSQTYPSNWPVGADRPGLLHEMSSVFADFGANVTDAGIKTVSQQARAIFRIEIFNRNQLKQILRRLQKIKGIENVSRVKDYILYPEDATLKKTSESL